MSWMRYHDLRAAVIAVIDRSEADMTVPDQSRVLDTMIAICSIAEEGAAPAFVLDQIVFDSTSLIIHEELLPGDDGMAPLLPWSLLVRGGDQSEATTYEFVELRGLTKPMVESTEDDFHPRTMEFLSRTWWRPLNMEMLTRAVR